MNPVWPIRMPMGRFVNGRRQKRRLAEEQVAAATHYFAAVTVLEQLRILWQECPRRMLATPAAAAMHGLQ